VIRELVANALSHQVIAVGGSSVKIDVYGNRVGISNPGEPVVPVERFIDGYESCNERLAEYIIKGFALDDERLKQAGGGKDSVTGSFPDFHPTRSADSFLEELGKDTRISVFKHQSLPASNCRIR